MNHQSSFEDEIRRLETAPLGLVPVDHPALYRRSLTVPDQAFAGPELAHLADRMWAILASAPGGVGLAAPQIGLAIALFLVDDGETRLTVVNPAPLDFGSLETIETLEGCLSLPGWRARTRRPARFGLQAQDIEGRPFVVRGEGLLARIFTHELDHLRGRLYLGRMIGPFEPDGAAPLAIEYRRWAASI